MEEADQLDFLSSIFNMLENEGIFNFSDLYPVVKFEHPNKIEEIIDFSLDNKISNFATLAGLCRQIIQYSVKTSHPQFHNQLYGGADLYGIGGSWIADALNTNQHTYEVAPAFTLCEFEVLRQVQKIFGIINGDGIMSPGGSLCNMYALALARHNKYPEAKTKGIKDLPKLVVFTSVDAHYSLAKGMNWSGLGTDNLVTINVDANGRMIVDELETSITLCITRGDVPLMVAATAGTTVLGAIDPLLEIANICKKYNIWYHVDACYGGTLMLSSSYCHLLKGIERCDSFAWNPHKMLGAPLQCSIFITSHQNLLHHCNCSGAQYLFQQDKFYDVSYDTGDKSIQCGRKVDGFKLWVMWKVRGLVGFENLIDNAMACAKYFKEQIKGRDGFRLVRGTFDTTCVCFWYIPLRLRNSQETVEWKNELYKVATKLKEKMVMAGTVMINYAPLPSQNIGNFLRIVYTCHTANAFKDVDHVITLIEDLGKDL